MVKYDPKKPLSEDEVALLPDEELFAYLDSKAKYLAKFAEPLDTYHTKNYLAQSKGRVLEDDEMKMATDIGRKGNEYRNERISRAATSSYDLHAKIKKKGSGWID